MAVFTKTLRKHIFIHPGDQHKIHTAIRTVLMKDKKKYSDRMGGALLDVNNIKMIGDRHLIVNGYVSTEIMADFQIFAPEVGMTLQGYINKVHKRYCGCVTMDFFNATLNYPTNFDVVPNEGEICSFVVESLTVSGDILHLRGQLTSIESKESSVENNSDAKSVDATPTMKESPKKKLHKIKLEKDNDTGTNNNTSELFDVKALKRDKSPKKKLHKIKLEIDDDTGTKNNTSELFDVKALKRDKSPKKKSHTIKLEEDSQKIVSEKCTNSNSSELLDDRELKIDKSPNKKSHKIKSKNIISETFINNDTSQLLDEKNFKSEISPKKEIPSDDYDSAMNSKETQDSLVDGKKKKKHKRKSKEDMAETTNGSDKTVKSEFEPSEDLIVEISDKSRKKKHKKKSKYDDDCAADLNNEQDDTLPSETSNEKSKRKRRRKRESERDDIQEHSTSPVLEVKRLKMEID